MVYKSNAEGRAQRVDSKRTKAGDNQISFVLPLDSFTDGGWYWFDLVAGEEGARLVRVAGRSTRSRCVRSR